MGVHSADDADQEVPVTPSTTALGGSKNPWKRWRNQVPGDRRWQTLWLVVSVIAIAIAAIGFTVGAQSRADSAHPDHTAVRAAVDGVTALMTFAPGDSPEKRAEVAKHLTGSIAADYKARGADVVFPNAVASKVTMTTTVSSAAPGEKHADFMTVLVFATQEIHVGQSDGYPERVGIARWITVTKVDQDWRVSRVENISPQ
ncbi:hypothetical protein ACH46_16020 [Gordonia phthalatica]|uniref:Mce-associated membrane protein n=2 Tax=Gordonia phthalatica TaxID=1136941 RepID=A0A0N9MUS9_9ACTN|nr:hypothetical protein ACH46_16020 [Gordonia phthalatica]